MYTFLYTYSGDKIQTLMTDVNSLPDFIFTAGFGEADLLRFGQGGTIIALEEYIDNYMPNLKSVFDKYPEYRKYGPWAPWCWPDS